MDIMNLVVGIGALADSQIYIRHANLKIHAPNHIRGGNDAPWTLATTERFTWSILNGAANFSHRSPSVQELGWINLCPELIHEHHFGMYRTSIFCQPSVDYSIYECADICTEAWGLGQDAGRTWRRLQSAWSHFDMCCEIPALINIEFNVAGILQIQMRRRCNRPWRHKATF